MAKLLTVLLATIIYFALTALLVGYAWDKSMVPMFGLQQISFAQACWLTILCHTLFNTQKGLEVAHSGVKDDFNK